MEAVTRPIQDQKGATLTTFSVFGHFAKKLKGTVRKQIYFLYKIDKN